MDRACLVSKANSGMFRHKVGAGVVAVRRAGAMHAFAALNHFFLISEMIVPGSRAIKIVVSPILSMSLTMVCGWVVTGAR
jgi:multimeric flavodoxin WrbA